MATGIGPSTNESTATLRADVSGLEPASFRFNNPGAQYPSAQAARFGQTGYGIIGGGHKIARFPSPVNGAAANFDLLSRNYTNMTIGAAGTKWTGAYGFGVPGYDPNMILTKAMLDDESQAIALLKAIAGRESGRGNNLTELQWRQAHAMFKSGSADNYLHSLPPEGPVAPAGPKTGAGLLQRAREHIGEEYRNVQVPKDNKDWKGPWDCSEFVSWLVYQEGGILRGCIDDDATPAEAKAYTGAWQRDSLKLGERVSVDEAASTVGGIVLRYPPGSGEMGHIVICDGKGGTVEAKGRRYGVVADTVHGRPWQTGIKIKGINYTAGAPLKVKPAEIVYEPGAPDMQKEIIVKIQRALAAKGFNPGDIDGEYGPITQAAVAEFQRAEGLVVDGSVGPETAEALGISLVGEEVGPLQTGSGVDGLGSNPLLQAILALLGTTGRPTGDDAARPGQGTDYLQLLLPLLLQATPAGRQIQVAQLLIQLLTGSPLGSPTPQPSPMPTDVSSLLPLLLQLLGGRAPGSPTPQPSPIPTDVSSLLPLLLQLLGGRAPVSPTPTPQPSPMPTDVSSLLPLLLQLLGGRAPVSPTPTPQPSPMPMDVGSLLPVLLQLFAGRR
jgi:peptidoglycan hydrolase-like protein with peptidoglycan-binding domain